MVDVVIVGGSTAGLSAALYLGRSLRRTIVFDAGEPCNRFSHASHGFFTRDGTPPAELLQIGREQLARYEMVSIQQKRVTAVRPVGEHFEVEAEDGTVVATRKVLLATGLHDTLPPLPNVEQFWGSSVFHCPFCDGWEIRDQPVAIYNNGDAAIHVAKLLRHLTPDLVLCTGAEATFSTADRQMLLARGVRIIETPVARLEGSEGQLEALLFTDGTRLERRALFIHPKTSQRGDLVENLGCALDQWGLVQVDQSMETSVPGVFAAGDTTTLARQLVFAAYQGAIAAVSIHRTLLEREIVPA